jgi:hypothetical protein
MNARMHFYTEERGVYFEERETEFEHEPRREQLKSIEYIRLFYYFKEIENFQN